MLFIRTLRNGKSSVIKSIVALTDLIMKNKTTFARTVPCVAVTESVDPGTETKRPDRFRSTQRKLNDLRSCATTSEPTPDAGYTAAGDSPRKSQTSIGLDFRGVHIRSVGHLHRPAPWFEISVARLLRFRTAIGICFELRRCHSSCTFRTAALCTAINRWPTGEEWQRMHREGRQQRVSMHIPGSARSGTLPP